MLPFVNLSSDKEQEFFSDGMTEEITTALAKVSDLRVVGRASAFQFKGANKDLRAIGQALSATHLIEGSVRKAGNRLRITAQLIKSDDGTQIWAEDYDRELTDVFAIQEGIARAITASLHMTLGLKPGENLINNRNIDPEAYTEYLRIRTKVRAVANTSARQAALAQLEKLTARRPDFAPAWAYLADMRALMVVPVYWTMWMRPVEDSRAMVQKIMTQAEREAREAIRLDPGQAYSYAVLATVEENRKNWANAGDLLKRAVQLDPNNAEILDDEARFEFQTGHIDDAVKLAREAQSLEPLSPAANYAVAVGLLAQGNAPGAIALLEARPDPRAIAYSTLAEAYAATGQFEKAAEQIAANGRNLYGATVGRKTVDAAEALMRSLAAKKPAPMVLPLPQANWIFAYAGETGRLMDEPERSCKSASSNAN